METDKNFIIEQEIYEMNLYEYLKDNGPLSDDKKFSNSSYRINCG